MKRIISAILTGCLLLGAMLSFSAFAEETQTGSAGAPSSYQAPVFFGTQVQAGDTGKVNIRFVSAVCSLAGAKLGYEITATYKENEQEKTLTFSGEKAESSTIFSTVNAGGTAVSAEDVAKEMKLSDVKGLFAVILTGVPADIDVTFSVTSYVKNTAGEKRAESSPETLRFVNGAPFVETVPLLFQDFNSMTLDAVCGQTAGSVDSDVGAANKLAYQTAVNTATGWVCNAASNNGTNGAKAKVENGKLTLVGGSGVDHYTLLPAGTISGYSSVIIEMDLNVAQLNSKMFVVGLHSVYGSGTTANTRCNEVLFRDCTSEARTATGGINAYLGVQYNAASTGAASRKMNTLKPNMGLTGNGYGQDFHLRIVVDYDAKTLKAYITPSGGSEAQVVDTVLNSVSGAPDGGLFIANQMATVTIDNIDIKAIPAKK